MTQISLPHQPNFVNLTDAARQLGVSVDTLLTWNESNILKPTITNTGEAGYRLDQIIQFQSIRQLTQHPTSISRPRKALSLTSILAFAISFSTTVATLVIILSIPVSENPHLVSTTLPLQPTPDIQIGSVSPQFDDTLTQTANFSPNDPSPDSVFDQEGNIKGNTPNTDVLAASINANSMIQNIYPVKPSINPNILFAFLPLTLLGLPFAFRKQLTSPVSQTAISPSSPYDQKVLEINQKTDGTVVLCFKGQEHKISKPELDSESDQFIERLMGLTPGIKEIDYDAGKDTEIKLSAPLSKLVTRLGFVGIKRDLFFPRTSKNRVLFRRFVTDVDLSSMKLNLDQLGLEFFGRTTQV